MGETNFFFCIKQRQHSGCFQASNKLQFRSTFLLFDGVRRLFPQLRVVLERRMKSSSTIRPRGLISRSQALSDTFLSLFLQELVNGVSCALLLGATIGLEGILQFLTSVSLVLLPFVTPSLDEQLIIIPFRITKFRMAHSYFVSSGVKQLISFGFASPVVFSKLVFIIIPFVLLHRFEEWCPELSSIWGSLLCTAEWSTASWSTAQPPFALYPHIMCFLAGRTLRSPIFTNKLSFC